MKNIYCPPGLRGLDVFVRDEVTWTFCFSRPIFSGLFLWYVSIVQVPDKISDFERFWLLLYFTFKQTKIKILPILRAINHQGSSAPDISDIKTRSVHWTVSALDLSDSVSICYGIQVLFTLLSPCIVCECLPKLTGILFEVQISKQSSWITVNHFVRIWVT